MLKIANKYLALAFMLLAGCGTTMSPVSNLTQTEQAEVNTALKQRDLKHIQSMELGLADIPVAQTYLNKLMARIQEEGPQPARFAQVVIRPKLSYNAATTPSGTIIIDIGWLKTIDSEAELVGLLSHEYAHIMLDHLQDRNTIGSSLEFLTKIYIKKASGNNDWVVGLVGESWSSLLNPNWSRNQELQADEFAFNQARKMGYSTLASVRAFLDRIQSVEKNAITATPTQSSIQTSLTDAHPKIEERIASINKLMAEQPRIRPTQPASGEWRTVRDSASFKLQEKEIVLATNMLEAIKAGKKSEAALLHKKLDAIPRPLKTAAAKTMLAYVQPNVSRRVAQLQQAIASSDTSFMAYGMLAATQRDQLHQFELANITLQEGLERFDYPQSHWPDVIEFHRNTMEMIDMLPKQQRDADLSLYAFKLKAKIIQLQVKCQLEPGIADACNWASMNAEQKQNALNDLKARESKMADQMTNRLKLNK